MNKKIKAYKIIRAQDVQALERDVNAALSHGWVPTGGIFSVNLHQVTPQPAIVVLQAMVQYED